MPCIDNRSYRMLCQRCYYYVANQQVIYPHNDNCFDHKSSFCCCYSHISCITYVRHTIIFKIFCQDMLKAVVEKRPSYNNNTRIVSNTSISLLKQYYYKIFTYFYGFVGGFSNKVIVNSTWTQRHMKQLWHFKIDKKNVQTNKRQIYKIFPPCNTTILENIPIEPSKRERIIISVGQFRPEKDHMLQLR